MDCDSKYFVYALVDPINRVPFYIGKGCGDRPYRHLDGRDNGNKKKIRYIENIRMLGFEPEVHTIKENMFESEAYKYESLCIKFMRNAPYITNAIGIRQPPSRKGCKWTPEQLKKRSETVRAKYASGELTKTISNEQKKKISNKLTGRKLSEEHKENIRKAQYRMKFKIEDIDKLKMQYLIENKSRKDLSNIYNCSEAVIKRILSENNIKKYRRKKGK